MGRKCGAKNKTKTQDEQKYINEINVKIEKQKDNTPSEKKNNIFYGHLDCEGGMR